MCFLAALGLVLEEDLVKKGSITNWKSHRRRVGGAFQAEGQVDMKTVAHCANVN